jgi:hypothetical protein
VCLAPLVRRGQSGRRRRPPNGSHVQGSLIATDDLPGMQVLTTALSLSCTRWSCSSAGVAQRRRIRSWASGATTASQASS